MRWSEAVTLEFVKIYLKHECLWNPAHAGYKLRYLREEAYTSITTEFKTATSKCLSIPEIKLKIKNLRTTYLQQVHKILQKSSPDSIYEPSLVWFHEMDQCLKHIPSGRHPAAHNNPQEIPKDPCQLWVEQKLYNGKYGTTEDSSSDPLISLTDDEYDPNRYEQAEKIKKERHIPTWENQELHNGTEAKNPDPLVPHSDEEYESTCLEETDEKIQKERPTLPLLYKKIKKKKLKHRAKEYFSKAMENRLGEDEFDIYGKYVASQLRKMDLRNALRLKLEIHSLMSEARLSGISSKD